MVVCSILLFNPVSLTVIVFRQIYCLSFEEFTIGLKIVSYNDKCQCIFVINVVLAQADTILHSKISRLKSLNIVNYFSGYPQWQWHQSKHRSLRQAQTLFFTSMVSKEIFVLKIFLCTQRNFHKLLPLLYRFLTILLSLPMIPRVLSFLSSWLGLI